MSQIVLDLGSGNSLKNTTEIEKIIHAVKEIDTGKHMMILKTQLFESAPPNKPLSHDLFVFAYHEAERHGYELTASVFDEESLEFLLGFSVPFVKIACRPELYYLAGEVLRKIPIYYSVLPGGGVNEKIGGGTVLCCVPKYPAKIKEYSLGFMTHELMAGISDHTVGTKLFKTYLPKIYECHFCVEHDKDNPDAGDFAKTPEELSEIL